MMRITLFLATLIGLMSAAVPAQAQLMRTFVSAASGNDANDCNRATPCRTFQGAHDKTLADGEITVLEPGGYGALRIEKSISIVNDGVGEASILVSGGSSGILIAAPADTRVNLRGITIQGIGFGGGLGLFFSTGLSLTMADCVIRNHTGAGILVAPRLSGPYNLTLSNVLLADNGETGLDITAQSNTDINLHAVLDRVRLLNNSIDGFRMTGIFSAGILKATVTNSIASGNHRDGFAVSSAAGKAATSLTLIGSASAHNGNGITASAPTTSLQVARSTLAGNVSAWVALDGAAVRSFGDNYIAGNAAGDQGPPVIVTK